MASNFAYLEAGVVCFGLHTFGFKYLATSSFEYVLSHEDTTLTINTLRSNCWY
jgi:hypothetical protein